jgi:hypothetical protein
MAEWGIFNDEGCIEDKFVSEGAAIQGMSCLVSLYRHAPDELGVSEICPDHAEMPKDTCEECFSE